MKKLLLILLCLPFIGFGQQTYVPDDNFEAYLEANGMGDGIPWNDSVRTSAIDTVVSLEVNDGYQGYHIFDLTGIEDFIALTYLNCKNNNITNLDLSNNIALDFLRCSNNQLISLNLSANTNLTFLDCGDNQLASLDISNNTNLITLDSTSGLSVGDIINFTLAN